MSFKEVFDLVGFPIITFMNNGKKYHFLFDTGSNNNVINSSLIKELKCEKASTSGFLSGLDGISHEVEHYNITFSYKNQEYPFVYIAKDLDETFRLFKKDFGVQLSGMIGTGFFAKYQYVIDFKDFIAYSKT